MTESVQPGAARSELSAVRRRLIYVLFSGAVLAWLAFVATLTVATVAARSLSGSTILAGIPLAAGALGQALGTNLLGRLSARYGRRFIMVVGPPVSACGAALELLGVTAGWYWMLVGGAILMGTGVGAIHLARYVAAELAEESERGKAVGIVVWSGTVGSVVGANLVDWVGRLAQEWLGTPYGGAFLLATVAFLLSGMIFWVGLRPDPSQVAVTSGSLPERGGTVGAALRLPSVQISILALLSAQGAMVLVMTATPLRIEDAGYGLDAVGLVLSIHAVGMFAFAPLVGKLVDRLGRLPMLGMGMSLTMVSLLLAGAAPYDGLFVLAAGLFVLGSGWSFSFIAASSMLFASAPPDVRQVVEGWADSAAWTMVMMGSVGSGVLMGTVGFSWLTATAALPMLLILALALAVPRLRTAIRI
ncbi:MAG: MFS transporter [Acidimicrobiia bacterium]|nr:MFS transporter [Acidimicrobiia bacterium]